MNLKERIEIASLLGQFITNFNNAVTQEPEENEKYLSVLQQAKTKNPWFTIENQQMALKAWGKNLTQENLNKWLSKYDLNHITPKNIGVICAGNIPMVGFHDILSVLMSGHKAQVKLSSQDHILIPYFMDYVMDIAPEIGQYISFVEKLEDFNAVIATGSNNTARYFEAYFGNVPHIIRKNRTSIAILQGDESKEDLNHLGKDIFSYFGLGCRNVTQLLVPKNYDFTLFFEAIYPYHEIINHHKYANNYDYNRAIYLMKNEPFLDNHFLLLKESDALFSPVATVFQTEYKDENALNDFLQKNSENIQCTIGNGGHYIPFGKAQQPELWDYADNVDTVSFLEKL